MHDGTVRIVIQTPGAVRRRWSAVTNIPRPATPNPSSQCVKINVIKHSVDMYFSQRRCILVVGPAYKCGSRPALYRPEMSVWEYDYPQSEGPSAASYPSSPHGHKIRCGYSASQCTRRRHSGECPSSIAGVWDGCVRHDHTYRSAASFPP